MADYSTVFPAHFARSYDTHFIDGKPRIGTVLVFDETSKSWKEAPDQEAERRAIMAKLERCSRKPSAPPDSWRGMVGGGL